MRKFVLSFIIFSLFSYNQIFAKQSATQSMTLEECLLYAAQNHTKIKNAILDYKIAVAKNKEVTGSALPQLSAKGGLSYAPLVAAFQVPDFISGAIKGAVQPQYLEASFRDAQVGTLPLAFQPKWTTTGTLELSQMLFNPAMLVALQARKTLEELASKTVELSVQDIKVAVSKAYYNILIAEKQQELILQNIARLSQMKNETEEIYKAGFAEKIDVDRIKVTLNNLKTQKIRTEQMIDLAYLSLKFQMGMPMEQSLSLADSLEENTIASGLLLKDLDFNARNEFQLLQIQKKLYEYDIKRYKLGWLPTLNFFGNYGYTLYNQDKIFSKEDPWQKSAMLGLNLNLPLFDGFQRRNQLKQAKYSLEKNQNDITNLKMALTLEKENARITLKNNLLALDNQKENMELAEEVYNTASIKYKEGVGSSLEVLDAESALKEAQTNYFSALYDVMTSRIDLKKALGLIQ